MKSFTRVIAISLIMATPVVWAQGSGNQRGPGGMMMSTEQMQEMQQNMSRMQEMAPKMRGSSGQNRQKLMQEHMELMQEQMQMMRGGMMGNQGMMNGQGMMGGKEMQGSSNQGNPAIKPEDRIEFMEKRMNQMQLMMEQMLEHQQELQDRAK
ncbi:hypothetical protein [Marinobacter maritimus]|uniref:hypothetical protein n=1 Tax=Marinobacter maritimus TaxID=277961 RepID=UPI0011A0E94A|nr:hypothetical protein [Marinobacter maritimus]